MRIGGLASGMDIDSIVKDLMAAERLKVDRVNQEKILSEWTRDAYNDVNKALADFVLNTRQSFGITDPTRSINSQNWIKSATIGNASIADVSARSSAVNGSYDIKVHNLATNWSAASSGPITAEGKNKSNLMEQFNLGADDKINFTIKTNKNEEGININIDDVGNTSLKDIVKQINEADIGVIAIYDESIDRFFLQTNETGEKNTIEIEDNSGFIEKLKITGGVAGEEGPTIYKGQGTDALIDFGAAKNIKQSSNQFTINNIDFNIKAKGETTVRVDTDENTIVDKLKGFIDQYNELIDKMDSVLSEPRHRDFRPLSPEQKEAMSDREVELWEEKAKSGLLRNDQLLNRTMQNLRRGLYEEVQNVVGGLKHLTDIGIQTEEYSSGSMGGKLRIADEDKLRRAIRDDVDGVMELLFKNPEPGTPDEAKRKNTGLINRLYGDMVTGMKEIITKAGPGDETSLYRRINSTMLLDFVTKHSSISLIDRNIRGYDRRIVDLERRLIDTENRYWSQFTAMEKALDRMYSQSNWLYQQMGM